MKKKVLILTSIFIIGFYILTLFYFKQQISKGFKQQNILSDSLEHITNKFFDLERNLKIGFQNECVSLPQNLSLKDENGESILLKNLVNKQGKLVFRFSEFSCSSCLKRLTEIISLESDYFKNNIIFISNYSDKKKLEFFRIYLNINYKIYFSDNLGLPVDSEGMPYFFILDNNMISKMFFIPIYSDKNLLKKYFDNVQSYLKSKEMVYNNNKKNILK